LTSLANISQAYFLGGDFQRSRTIFDDPRLASSVQKCDHNILRGFLKREMERTERRNVPVAGEGNNRMRERIWERERERNGGEKRERREKKEREVEKEKRGKGKKDGQREKEGGGEREGEEQMEKKKIGNRKKEGVERER
jgi:hypothetical protein